MLKLYPQVFNQKQMERKVNYGQRWDGKFNETGADDAGIIQYTADEQKEIFS